MTVQTYSSHLQPFTMIVIITPRQYAEFANNTIFVYIDLLAETKMKNLVSVKKTHDDYLFAILMICLLHEVKIIFKKRLINSTAKTLKIKMSMAHGIAFYKTLLSLPVPADNFYFNHIRNLWIESLDQQIVK